MQGEVRVERKKKDESLTNRAGCAQNTYNQILSMPLPCEYCSSHTALLLREVLARMRKVFYVHGCDIGE